MSWFKHKVSLSMGMSSGGPASDGGVRHQWRIKVDDATSGARILELELSLEEFARALGHHYLSNVSAELAHPEFYAARVGKRHDVKVVELPLGGVRENEAVLALCRETIKPFLVDHWQLGSELDQYNWHHLNHTKGTYSVSLHRWVDSSVPKEVRDQPPVLAPVAKPKRRKKGK